MKNLPLRSLYPSLFLPVSAPTVLVVIQTVCEYEEPESETPETPEEVARRPRYRGQLALYQAQPRASKMMRSSCL